MNYGKRFNNGRIAVSYHYDEKLHKGMIPGHFSHMDTLDRQLSGIKGAAQASANKSHCYLGQPVQVDERYEAEKRMVHRINQAIDVLIFGAQELMMAPPSINERHALVSQWQLVEMIGHMCRMIGRDTPDWGVSRRAGITTVRRCIDCGTELTATEKERCSMCGENTLRIHKQKEIEAARELRQRNREIAREAKRTAVAMQAALKRIRRKQRERYSGYSCEDAGAVAAGGREQDQRLGGEAAHRDCAGDTRHSES